MLEGFFLKNTIMKYLYDELPVLIPANDLGFSKTIDLKKGICVGVKYINFEDATKADRDFAIDIDVNSNSGDLIVGRTDYRDFINEGGGYIGGFKPCRFDTKAQIRVDVIPEVAMKVKDFKGVIVFMIEAENQTV